MKTLVTAVLAFALSAGFAVAANESPIEGTWQGEDRGVPVVTLKIKDDHGKLSGTVVFYRIVDNGGGPQAEARDSVEMLDPKLEGNIFSFQTKGSQGELVSYQMELTGKNEGKFKGKAMVTGGGGVPEIPMIRKS